MSHSAQPPISHLVKQMAWEMPVQRMPGPLWSVVELFNSTYHLWTWVRNITVDRTSDSWLVAARDVTMLYAKKRVAQATARAAFDNIPGLKILEQPLVLASVSVLVVDRVLKCVEQHDAITLAYTNLVKALKGDSVRTKITDWNTYKSSFSICNEVSDKFSSTKERVCLVSKALFNLMCACFEMSMRLADAYHMCFIRNEDAFSELICATDINELEKNLGNVSRKLMLNKTSANKILAQLGYQDTADNLITTLNTGTNVIHTFSTAKDGAQQVVATGMSALARVCGITHARQHSTGSKPLGPTTPKKITQTTPTKSKVQSKTLPAIPTSPELARLLKSQPAIPAT